MAAEGHAEQKCASSCSVGRGEEQNREEGEMAQKKWGGERNRGKK